MSRTQRLLVVGAGSIGRRHARNLKALGQDQVRLVDPDAEALRRAEAVSPSADGTPSAAGMVPSRSQETGWLGWRSLDEAWAWKPEAVVVATPTSLHLETALEAARHGCHLLIEKPLADRLDGVEELERLVQARRLTALVGCNMRFREGPKRVQQAVAAGQIGRPLGARFEAGSYLPQWRPGSDYRTSYSASAAMGGGCFLDHIHEIDAACWMFGLPRQVTAVAKPGRHLNIETEALAELLLEYDSDLLVSIHLDYVQRWRQRRYEVIGQDGTIVWDARAERVDWLTAARQAPETVWQPPVYDANQMYVDEVAHWLRCLDGREAPCADIGWGARVLRVTLAAKASAAARRPVAIDQELSSSARPVTSPSAGDTPSPARMVPARSEANPDGGSPRPVAPVATIPAVGRGRAGGIGLQAEPEGEP